MGTNSLPFMLEVISHEDSLLKEKFITQLEKLNFLGLQLPFTTHLKGATCFALKALGTNSTGIVPHLATVASNPNLMGWAFSALFAIGSAGAPGFITACGNTNLLIRAEAALYLSKVSDGSQRGAGWHWGRYPSSQRPHAFLSCTIGGDDDAIAIARQLKHPNVAVRRASVEALSLYCRQRKSVLPDLRKALQDERPEVRTAAMYAIRAFESDRTIQ